MNRFLKHLFILFIALNIFLSSWYVLHKDLYFQTDIARDFLLLQELDQKKLVLLGPRSSTGGLFHGPLWMYLNYPAYVVGHGDPIVVGWYWIVLVTIFLVTGFIIAKKLFSESTAYLYTLLISAILIFETRSLFNPHGAFFLMPAFLFFFVRFVQTGKLKTLLLFLLIAGCMIQFQMAIGIPLLILATLPISYLLYKRKKYHHFAAFLVLLIPLSTFIVFDLKHHFLQLHAVLSYIFGNNFDQKTYGNVFGLIGQRLHLVTAGGFGIFKDAYHYKNELVFVFVAIVVFQQIKINRFKLVYASTAYFYLGYYVLSLINKSGGMLYHYYFPLYPLVFLIFASLITSPYKKLFLLIFLFAYWSNFSAARAYLAEANVFFGHDQNSWQFLSGMTKHIYQGSDKQFGYFLYMPDALSYQTKYAMNYAARNANKTSYYFQKKPITYLVIAPPPADKIGMEDSWWRINQVKIAQSSQSVVVYPNGYKVERYVLASEEQKIPFDPAIDTGIHFR